MSRWARPNFTLDYGLAREGVVFDPGTLTAVSLASTAAGGAISASSTLAGGSYAAQAGQLQKTAADYQATELEQNASQAFASGQRKALDTTQRTNLAISTSRARAAASGVNAGVGSPVTNAGNLAQRGSYQALMDMFNGESEATGLRNQSQAVRFGGDLALMEGEEKQRASRLAALGTLAGTAGSMAGTYGAYNYPNLYGRAGAQV
jgi:hypothetical protein